jgi:hypothetical protein
MTQYQCWALSREGVLLSAGPRRFERVGPSVIRKYVADWEQWADTIAAEHPDCSTAKSRRRTTFVCIHPIGKPEEKQSFRLA